MYKGCHVVYRRDGAVGDVQVEVFFPRRFFILVTLLDRVVVSAKRLRST